MIPTAEEIGDVQVLKTDTFLDDLTGVFGLPKERIIEFYGAEKTGKSTASVHVIAAAQRQGLRCLLVDVEHSFTPKYAADLGVDNGKLGVIRELYAEDIIDKTEEAIKSGEWDLVVFDSIGSLSSRVEDEKKAEERTIGVQASLMGRFVRKLAPQVSYRKMVFIGINHSRTDIMTGKITTMGGRASMLVMLQEILDCDPTSFIFHFVILFKTSQNFPHHLRLNTCLHCHDLYGEFVYTR